MKPIYICGPIARLGVDNGLFRVEKDAAFRFLSETTLPIPLLVEHVVDLNIGQVLKLHVENERLVASCVIDDSCFLGVLSSLQDGASKYQSMDTGSFLNILFPSLSSFHTNGRFTIHEISLVDIGRREGTLWCVDKLQEPCRGTMQRTIIPLQDALLKLLYLLFRQRQHPNRNNYLCKQAHLCGRNTEFVLASSLSPLRSIQPSRNMVKPKPAEIKGVLKALMKEYAHYDSTDPLESDEQESSSQTMYTYNDIKDIVLSLAKEKVTEDKNRLEHAKLKEVMKKAMRGKIIKEGVRKRQADMYRDKRDKILLAEPSSCEDDVSDDETFGHGYTCVPVKKRIGKMMTSVDNRYTKKTKLNDGRCNKKRVHNEQCDMSDTDTEVREECGKKKPNDGRDNRQQTMHDMHDGIKHIVSILSDRTHSPNELQKPIAQQLMEEAKHHEKTNYVGCTLNKTETSPKEKDVSDMKCSAVQSVHVENIIDELFP